MDALKKRAAQEGITLSSLVQRQLREAMEDWEPTPSIQMRLDNHEERLRRLEQHLRLLPQPT